MDYIRTYSNNAACEADATKKYPHVSYIEDTDTLVYEDENPNPWPEMYLTIEAIESGTLSYTTPGTSYNKASYSLDNGETWTELNKNTASPTLNAGEKMLLKGNMIIGSGGMGTFTFTGRHNVMGNPLSLYYGDDFSEQTDLTGKNRILSYLFNGSTGLVSAEHLALPTTTLPDSCYSSMFSGCTSLTTAPELPATTLAESVYRDMFNGCTSLTAAPALPATNIFPYCYYSMFKGCTSLTTTPELSASSLTSYCYQGMFSGCTSLNYIKMLATDISPYRCLRDWVSGVASSGTFVKNASMTTLPSGADGIPANWTVVDAS